MNKWDLYNEKLEKTGKIVDENVEIEDGYYHWTTNCWIINSKKQLLLLRSSLNYNLHYPGFWRGINGNVLSDKTPLDTVINSVYNKIGVKINMSEIKELSVEKRDPYHYVYNTFIVEKDINISDIEFIDGTIVQAKLVDLKELYNMIENGEIAWVLISRLEKHVIPLLK